MMIKLLYDPLLRKIGDPAIQAAFGMDNSQARDILKAFGPYWFEKPTETMRQYEATREGWLDLAALADQLHKASQDAHS